MQRRKPAPPTSDATFWPAVVDVFVGFTGILIVALLTAFADLGKEEPGLEPPPAKESFVEEFLRAFSASSAGSPIAPTKPKVEDLGFSEIKIYFPASFLFEPCHTTLRTPAVAELANLRALFRRFDQAIARVQVTGHTDSDRPTEGSFCFQQGIRTNWELSARRAITVLELLAPEDGSGLDPRKVWAAALGEYHPVVGGITDRAKARNRRIEVVVRFME